MNVESRSRDIGIVDRTAHTVHSALPWTRRVDLAAQRAFDALVAGAGLVVSMPIWVVAALAVKLEDGGPIFYSQERAGRAGRVFRVYKFRSMIPDAEARVGALQATAGDPRVTRTGR